MTRAICWLRNFRDQTIEQWTAGLEKSERDHPVEGAKQSDFWDEGDKLQDLRKLDDGGVLEFALETKPFLIQKTECSGIPWTAMPCEYHVHRGRPVGYNCLATPSTHREGSETGGDSLYI